MTTTVEHAVEVERDVRTVYNQWTQFEDFPEFMEGVKRVEQKDDKRLHWEAEIAGTEREWEAEIVEQEPDRVIAWRATGQVRNDGRVTFEPMDGDRTRVHITFDYDPEGFLEKVGDVFNVVDRRIKGDLERFKQFIEERGAETGAWRGEIHGTEVQPGDEAGPRQAAPGTHGAPGPTGTEGTPPRGAPGTPGSETGTPGRPGPTPGPGTAGEAGPEHPRDPGL
jgi:carbon monoxide dehydrogenase subunit G